MKRALLLVLPLLVACSSNRQLTSMGQVPQRVSVDVQETNYTIVGETAQDLLDGMRIGGPRNSWFWFTWNMRWSYDQNILQQTSLSRGSVSQNR